MINWDVVNGLVALVACLWFMVKVIELVFTGKTTPAPPDYSVCTCDEPVPGMTRVTLGPLTGRSCDKCHRVIWETPTTQEPTP